MEHFTSPNSRWMGNQMGTIAGGLKAPFLSTMILIQYAHPLHAYGYIRKSKPVRANAVITVRPTWALSPPDMNQMLSLSGSLLAPLATELILSVVRLWLINLPFKQSNACSCTNIASLSGTEFRNLGE